MEINSVSMVTQYGYGASNFIETPSLGDCQPRLKNDSSAIEMKVIFNHASKWYFKRYLGITA